jgi:alpha-tubulin suppressor-like RCC1 family protein
MPFISDPDGDLKTAFVSDAFLLDQFVGNTLFTWGYNPHGTIGDNTSLEKSNPVQTVTGGINWKFSGGGLSYTQAAIKTDGTLWTCGYNYWGCLGDNTNIKRSSPVQTVAFGTNWKQVASGYFQTGAIKTDGTLWTWGNNSSGQLGDNTILHKSSPIQTVAFGINWKQFAGGFDHCAAIKTDGTLWTWGNNASGQLGDNTIVTKSSPVQTIVFGSNWKQVSCGLNYTAAIKTDGTLWAWGLNSNGQLGDNTIVKKSSPVQTVAFGTNWKQVTCNETHMAATKTDGTLWIWGLGTTGQLGDNTILSKSSPVQTVAFGTNWKQVSAGYKFTACVKTDGTLWAWGSNGFGQLGNNTITNRSSPVQTSAYGNNWKQVSCNKYNTAAVTNGDI